MCFRLSIWHLRLKPELIQTQMAQKPMLRLEVYARASGAEKREGTWGEGGRSMRLIKGHHELQKLVSLKWMAWANSATGLIPMSPNSAQKLAWFTQKKRQVEVKVGA
jgi:hypothetical protein